MDRFSHREAPNYESTTDPTVNADIREGFAVGSRWFNKVSKKIFFCADITAGAAVWHDQGEDGPQGPTGPAGDQGIQGVQGIQGSDGAPGTQGIQGDIGPAGTQGIQGIQGIQGDDGSQGDQGSQGDIGATGTQGNQGIQGVAGTQGDQGDTGPAGSQGIQGIQGVSGSGGPAENTIFNVYNTATQSIGAGPTVLTLDTARNPVTGITLSADEIEIDDASMVGKYTVHAKTGGPAGNRCMFDIFIAKNGTEMVGTRLPLYERNSTTGGSGSTFCEVDLALNDKITLVLVRTGGNSTINISSGYTAAMLTKVS